MALSYAEDLALRHFLTDSIRAGEWWEYKLVPILAVYYATALTLHVPVRSIGLGAVTLLLSVFPGAAYVSVINDITDRAEDAAAGKPNRMAGRSPLVMATLTAIPVAAGIAFSFLWRHDALLLAFYLAAWTVFSLYSLPPFRFKTRGILGVLCDASGAHLFPTLVAVVLAYRAAHRPVSAAWLVAVAVWAFGYGLRGILWHQLTDRDHDRSAAVRTFAERHEPDVAVRLGTFIAFPLELAAFAAMLWMMGSIWPPLFLAGYLVIVRMRMKRWDLRPIVVKPEPRFFIVLSEYYDALLPVSILLASLDGLVLALHLLVFPVRLERLFQDARRLVAEWLHDWMR